MIVVKVELWPLGDESRAQDLGQAHIDLQSQENGIGSYRVRLLKGAKYSPRPGTLYKGGTVPAFPRVDRRWGPWELLALALEATVGQRINSLKRHLSNIQPPAPGPATKETP